MEYSVKASSISKSNASIHIKDSDISFGITSETDASMASPAELYLAAFSACVLKNVERFSGFMKFEYSKAEIEVTATRLDKPPRMDELNYTLKVYTGDSKLNAKLLKKNLEKFGTIYNTVKLSSTITGEIIIVDPNN